MSKVNCLILLSNCTRDDRKVVTNLICHLFDTKDIRGGYDICSIRTEPNRTHVYDVIGLSEFGYFELILALRDIKLKGTVDISLFHNNTELGEFREKFNHFVVS